MVSVISDVDSCGVNCGTRARSATRNSIMESGGVVGGTCGEAMPFKHNSHAATRWWWRERSRPCCQDMEMGWHFAAFASNTETSLVTHPLALIVRFQRRIMGFHQPHIKCWHIGRRHVWTQEVVRQFTSIWCTFCTTSICSWLELHIETWDVLRAIKPKHHTISYQTAKFRIVVSVAASIHEYDNAPSSRNSWRIALSLSCLRKKFSCRVEAVAETLRTSRGMHPSRWSSTISMNHSHMPNAPVVSECSEREQIAARYTRSDKYEIAARYTRSN